MVQLLKERLQSIVGAGMLQDVTNNCSLHQQIQQQQEQQQTPL